MDENTDKGISAPRGGRGSAGRPADIRESIADAQKEAVRIDHDLAKLKNDKDALLFIIADLRVKEKQSVNMGISSDTDAIRKELIKAQENIDKINGVIHETNSPDDHKKIQKIVSDWYGRKHDFGNEKSRLQKAEKLLESNPGDRRVQGDANRARAQMQIVNEQLGDIAKQAEGVFRNATVSAAENDGISFTHEQAMLERKALEARHKKSQIEAVPEINTNKENTGKEALIAGQEEIVQETKTQEHESDNEIHVDSPILFQNKEETHEVKFLPDPETDDNLLPIVIEQTKEDVAVPKVHHLALGCFIKKIFNFFSRIIAKSKQEPKVFVEIHDIVPATETPVQEIVKEMAHETTASYGDFLEKPLFTEFETSEQTSVGTTIEPELPQEESVVIAEELTPEKFVPVISELQEILPEETKESTAEESVAQIPQEITPGDATKLAQIEIQAEEVLQNDIDMIFGEKKGPFGILGHTNGIESKDWKDPQVGFGAKTVGDILKASPLPPNIDDNLSFGIENLSKVEKMKKYLANVNYISGLSLEANEGSSIPDFIRRSAIAKLSK
ncbi:MAG: hypothetical protein WAV98_03380 [Minisyncoccia bacterium]